MIEAIGWLIVAVVVMYLGKVIGVKDVSSFEVAAIDVDGEFLGDPKGWQSREDINELIKIKNNDRVNRRIISNKSNINIRVKLINKYYNK